MKYTITCRFCSKPTGEIDRPDLAPGTIINPGIADSRCDACMLIHGDYKEMHDIYLQDIGDHESFKKVMLECSYSLPKFAERIMMLRPEYYLMLDSHHIQSIDTHHKKIIQELELNDVPREDRAKVVKDRAAEGVKFVREIPIGKIKAELAKLKK